MSSSNTVVRVQPPAPPGPATFDYTRFGANASMTMVDTANLTLNSNYLDVGRVRVTGDPNNPLLPSITAPIVATQILYAPYLTANGLPKFRASLVLSNNMTQSVGSLLVGEPVVPPPVPTWSILQRGSITVSNNQTLGQQIGTGMVVGPGTLYCGGPRPPLASSGTLIDLNGGSIYGSCPIYL